jgi:hypothetical protein
VSNLWPDGENRSPHPGRPADNAKPRAWRAGHAERAAGPDVKPRSAEDNRPDPAAARMPAQPAREVGSHRRRIEGHRPDLQVINGEGTGGRTSSGRLRPVRENPT